MIEWAHALIDLVKAIVWPCALVGIAVVFADDIRKLLPRIIKAGPTGVEFEAQKQQAAQRVLGELRQLPGISRTPTIAAVEKRLHEELAIINEDSRLDLLVRQLAQSQLQTRFERIFGIMFGSQLEWLKALLNAGGAVSRVEANRFFEEQVETNADLKQLNITFVDWLRYLLTSDLVAEDEAMLKLTDEGRDFLLYISASHAATKKAG